MEYKSTLYLRHYQPADFPCVKTWVTDERTHALWSAGHMPAPLTEDAFAEKLMQGHTEWNDEAFVCTDECDHPLGFAVCSITPETQQAYIKYVIVDPFARGLGVGTLMIQMLLDRIFAAEGVHFVKLNVFDTNKSAIRCYQKAGFRITNVTPNIFAFQDESWGRISMQKDR